MIGSHLTYNDQRDEDEDQILTGVPYLPVQYGMYWSPETKTVPSFKNTRLVLVCPEKKKKIQVYDVLREWNGDKESTPWWQKTPWGTPSNIWTVLLSPICMTSPGPLYDTRLTNTSGILSIQLWINGYTSITLRTDPSLIQYSHPRSNYPKHVIIFLRGLSTERER